MRERRTEGELKTKNIFQTVEKQMRLACGQKKM